MFDKGSVSVFFNHFACIISPRRPPGTGDGCNYTDSLATLRISLKKTTIPACQYFFNAIISTTLREAMYFWYQENTPAPCVFINMWTWTICVHTCTCVRVRSCWERQVCERLREVKLYSCHVNHSWNSLCLEAWCISKTEYSSDKTCVSALAHFFLLLCITGISQEENTIATQKSANIWGLLLNLT